MKKKIYYTVDIEFHNGDLEMGPTGHKTINVYSIKGQSMSKDFDIECELSDVSQKEIQNYLIDNGMGDEEFEFIQL